MKRVLRVLLRPRPAPFSILKRIVMGETTSEITYAYVGGSFQYPQADRDG